MKLLTSILFFCFSFNLAHAQEDWLTYPDKPTQQKPSNGKVTYEEDSRTTKLIEFMAVPVPPEYKVLLDGYRVQIFFSNDRELINKQRERFTQQNPNVPTYVVYDAPNYSIKAGNFRTELEAEELRSRISFEFPSSIIQKSKIELPAIKRTNPVEEGR